MLRHISITDKNFPMGYSWDHTQIVSQKMTNFHQNLPIKMGTKQWKTWDENFIFSFLK